MKEVTKKRLCWNCEGSVSFEEETCPFCGVSVIPASLDGTSNSFVPSYSPHLTHNQEIPPSPYEPWESSQQKEIKKEQPAPVVETSIDEFKKVVFAVTFLLAGSVFFLFGLALVLFSTEGTFSLRWDGTLWYFYMFLSIPLLYFGWNALMKLDS